MFKSLNNLRSFSNLYKRKYHGLTGGQIIYHKLLTIMYLIHNNVYNFLLTHLCLSVV